MVPTTVGDRRERLGSIEFGNLAMPDEIELPLLSETQQEIMQVIWDSSPCTVADVWKVLNSRRGVSRNTVQTLIVRLEEKGWLTHQDLGGVFQYRPTVPREKAQQQVVRKLIETVFDGSAENLVLTLLNGSTVTSAEAKRIRGLIAQARRTK
jgi:predicted transcriptional regulator